jgi:hypothetical protein
VASERTWAFFRLEDRERGDLMDPKDKTRDKLIEAVASGDEAAIVKGLALMQEQLVVENALSAPFRGGLAACYERHPTIATDKVTRALATTDPNTIIGAVAYGYYREGKGTAQWCVDHVMAGGLEVYERVADLIEQKVGTE